MSGPIAFCDAQVFHARLRPHGLRFRYAVTSLLVDLDRLDEADRMCPLFSVGRFNLFGFDPRDHGQPDAAALRAHVDAVHAQARLARPDRVILCCLPRLLGFVFDPVGLCRLRCARRRHERRL
jgi:DUF1365 family protein